MPIGVLTEFKTEILPKNGATLGRVHTDVSTIDEVANVEVDTDKADENKTRILTRILTNVDDVVVIKAEEFTGIDEDKIVEKSVALTEHDDETGAEGAGSVAEEVIVSLVDEVVDTSIVETWS